MKKKYIFLISLIVILTLFAVGAAILVNNIKTKEKNENINIDLEKLDTYFEENGDFNLANMKQIDEEYLTSVLDLPIEKIDDYIGKVPIVNIHSNMYIIIKTKETKDVNEIKEKLENYLLEYKKEWESFLLSEHDIVYDAQVNQKGKYVYLVISRNNEDLEKYIN